MKNIAIIGSGSWGVALAIHLNKLGNNIKIWSYSQEETDLINEKHECRFLPNIKLDEKIQCFTNFEHVIEDSDIIFHVTPSKVTRQVFKQYKGYIKSQPIIICSKGFESDTLLTLDDVIHQELPTAKVAALSGPSHAEEVSIGIPTAIVIASEDDELTEFISDILMNENLRIYTSKDIKGVEIGGALKNIIAFCAGIVKALDLGDNTNAALITRGLSEINKLGVALGAKFETFYGLAGLGDLIVTALSQHSRNRKAGYLLGKGNKIEDIKKEIGMVIEGVENTEVAYKLAKINNIEMPIVNSVYNILYNSLEPKDALNQLMTRKKREE